jgi:hypothetical protein
MQLWIESVSKEEGEGGAEIERKGWDMWDRCSREW